MLLCVADNTKNAELRQIQTKLGIGVPKLAEKLGIKYTTLKNYIYKDDLDIPDSVILKARQLLAGEVSAPLYPAPQLLIPIPFIGSIAASDPVDWTDPLSTETLEYVPPEMGDGRGRFCCRVLGDSMFDLLFPGDLAVFQSSPIPKVGAVTMFRTFDNLVTIKTLKHDGQHYYLHPENSAYEDTRPNGAVIGFLVGIVREIGSRRVTVFDASGIRP